MPQLSLYVDDAMMGQMRKNASREGLSLSKYAARAIRERIETPARVASEGYWDQLYGCLADDDSFVRPQQLETRPISSLDVE